MIAATTALRPSQPSAIHPADLNPEVNTANPLIPASRHVHPPRPSIEQALRSAIPRVNDESRATSRFVRWLSQHLQCSQRDVDSLPLFTTPTLCFHPLTDSFWKNGGVWGGSMTKFFQPKTKHPPKGGKPRTAWGEASRGLGVTARTGP